MTVSERAELRPVVEGARQRIASLREDIRVRGDRKGRKTRELQRLELYASVLRRLNHSDALMPEVALALMRVQD